MSKFKRCISWIGSICFVEGIIDTFSSLRLYWKSHGGVRGILGSFYVYLALIIAYFIMKFGDPTWNWASDTKQIIACTVGFSFAGYSLMLGMAGDKFIKIIKGDFGDGKQSPLMTLAGAFTHFFIVQCLTLLYAISASAFGIADNVYARSIGVFLLSYSILVLIATALAALNFLSWYNDCDLEQ